MTGSERAGSAVAEVAGRNLKKVVLELGGSDPFIVLDDDDLDAAVEGRGRRRFENAGQACNGAKRFIVVEDLYDEFVEKFTAAMAGSHRVTRPTPATRIGPLSSARRAAELDEQIEDATSPRGRGPPAASAPAERRLHRGYRAGRVTRDMRAYREELFGPVGRPLPAWATRTRPVELANDSPVRPGLGPCSPPTRTRPTG